MTTGDASSSGSMLRTPPASNGWLSTAAFAALLGVLLIVSAHDAVMVGAGMVSLLNAGIAAIYAVHRWHPDHRPRAANLVVPSVGVLTIGTAVLAGIGLLISH
ncbi:hypothetical protein [Rhodococcus qingshengii]|uniref:hypothetical protein n=1 Tax=Rhodococcus qingshengii TaxID=334542 RepID=UPI0024BB3D10|nr:hypothetical protein [Rhodococcus qingshengii]MDJ0441446.1 hypothetical protein [Rhodococcus qingshengii]